MKDQLLAASFLLTVGFLCPAATKAQVISAGTFHSLSVCPDSTARSWGRNYYGQLGVGDTTNRYTPTPVSSLTGVTAVEGGMYHSLFLKSDGTVWACGRNGNGQLGDGTTTDSNTPVQVNSLTGIIAVAGGQGHSLFLKSDGTVWACGSNNTGQLGDGTTNSTSIPVQVSSLTGITAVASGGGGIIAGHSLFVKNDGTVWACGSNGSGQLGDGTTTNRWTPVQVTSLTGIIGVAGAARHSLFVKNDGTAWACGANNNGQLGDGTTTDRSTPVQVTSLTGITAAAAGGSHFNQTGLSSSHSVFLKSDGTVWACGRNNNGQLGDGSTTTRSTPAQVTSLTGITEVACGSSHSLFLKSDGTMWACGSNGLGALGNGTTTNSSTPVQVTGPCDVSATTGDLSDGGPISVFPNPSSGQFSVMVPGSLRNAPLEVRNAMGQAIPIAAMNRASNELDLSAQPDGIYFLTIRTSEGIFTERLIKQ